MYPKSYRTLLPHWLRRMAFAILGIILLYAPFALLTRGLLWLTGTPLLPDAHRICLRMPIQWLGQPWMYGTMIEQPMYLVAVLFLPAVALFTGPLFCGSILRATTDLQPDHGPAEGVAGEEIGFGVVIVVEALAFRGV